MEGIEAPDFIGSLTGWRVWLVEYGFNLSLVSHMYRQRWPIHGGWARATCANEIYDGWAPNHIPHDAPGTDCRCGLYAVKEPKRALKYMPSKLWDLGTQQFVTTRMVMGRVEMKGEMYEGPHGYRAAYARPLEIYVPLVFHLGPYFAEQARDMLGELYEAKARIVHRLLDLAEA